MSNPSPVGTAGSQAALAIAQQQRIAGQNRPQPANTAADRVSRAIDKAQQSSPAMRRNPAAVNVLASRLRPLADGAAAKRPLASAARGVGVLGAARTITRDALKDFRKGAGEVGIQSSHELSSRASHHANEAAGGLRRGGLGLLSAAFHGVAAVADMRKTTHAARKAFASGAEGPGIERSHALSERGSTHVDAAAAGLKRGGFGLLSAAYHGMQALRELRSTAHGGRAVQPSRALTPMAASPSAHDAGASRSQSSDGDSGAVHRNAIAESPQASGMDRHRHDEVPAPHGDANSPLTAMSQARTRSVSVHSGPSGFAPIEASGEESGS